MIGLCIDSNAQLPVELAARYRIEVVPLVVLIDGVEHLEGVDLDADAFYALFTPGRWPEVKTAAPAPGRFGVAYERLAAAGADEIVSVHVGSDVSGTFNSARLAADAAPVPVHLVDTHSASFVVSCAALAAAEVIEGGGDAGAAVAAAEDVAGRCSNVFVVGTLDLARASGRLDPSAEGAGGIPVLRLAGGKMTPVGQVFSASEAAEVMAEDILAAGAPLRVGVGVADESSIPIADGLRRRLDESGADIDVIPYRVGPSVGAHTGPGTAGAVYHLRR